MQVEVGSLEEELDILEEMIYWEGILENKEVFELLEKDLDSFDLVVLFDILRKHLE